MSYKIKQKKKSPKIAKQKLTHIISSDPNSVWQNGDYETCERIIKSFKKESSESSGFIVENFLPIS